jgi:hypothetical protein
LAEFKSEELNKPAKKMGFSVNCRSCLRSTTNRYKPEKKDIVSQIHLVGSLIIKDGEKYCQMCKVVKGLHDFNGLKRKVAYCKSCMSNYRKNNRLKDKLK